ncbi:unnamed protein product [Ceratitis capitata]|uniref:(Mediterranean fruit fly) hypothetical protein n=1 Tax=Ceratitis capitata TaxID=7213 RepID=A0A811U2U4_CERCA|nr:unnamed protein product [Ceratitis capitata]
MLSGLASGKSKGEIPVTLRKSSSAEKVEHEKHSTTQTTIERKTGRFKTGSVSGICFKQRPY